MRILRTTGSPDPCRTLQCSTSDLRSVKVEMTEVCSGRGDLQAEVERYGGHLCCEHRLCIAKGLIVGGLARKGEGRRMAGRIVFGVLESCHVGAIH